MGVKMDMSAFTRFQYALTQAAEKAEKNLGTERGKRLIKKSLAVVTDDAKARINAIKAKHGGGASVRLAPAIETRIHVTQFQPTEIECGISYKRHQEAHHAHLVEGGHEGNEAPPYPFWEPALRAHEEEAVKAIEAALYEIYGDILPR